MSDKGYNGWSNYETWVMALWIDNEEGSYDYARELTEQVRIDVDNDRPDVQSWGDVADEQHRERTLVADALEAWLETAMYDWEDTDRPACVFTDLLHKAFGNVDWVEIAEHYIDELANA